MPREAPPTLNLEQVQVLTQSDNPTYTSCHVFGILLKEHKTAAGASWHIFDEIKEIELKLCGKLSEYPRPRPGDVVRVHRLRINKHDKSAEVVVPKNVLVWPAFQHDSTPIHLSRNPTISPEDNTRRRVLESFYWSKVERVSEILTNRLPGQFCQAVAGRIDEIQLDGFQHLEFDFTDGTGKMRLRVFRKTNVHEDEHHFKMASEMQKGQFFVATNVKYDMMKRVNLSANLAFGRSLRKVEESSIFGTKLREAIPDEGSQTQQATSSSTHEGPRRKSPRLLKQSQELNNEANSAHRVGSTTQITTDNESYDHTNGTTTSNCATNTVAPPNNQFPKFTLYCDLKAKSHGYEFHDIIGQVREKPLRVSQYNNCALQIFDGSPHNHSSFYADQVGRVVDGCLVLLVYSKQKELDTNEHLEKAEKLNEGDILLIKNVKVSFVQGKIKLELQANKTHDKSINVIDKSTPFGRKVLDIVETPQVQELREMIDPPSSEDSYEDC